MLLKLAELHAIRDGTLTVVFRRWRRPSVKSGGTLKTAVGVLAIERVEAVEPAEISARDVRAAGFASATELLAALGKRDGEIYRIEVRYAGADPRIELRENDRLSSEELAAICDKLTRWDGTSRCGPWTRKVLAAIEEHPLLVASALATATGLEKEWLKTHVRKLKNLGLTISRTQGYEISARGRVVLQHLRD